LTRPNLFIVGAPRCGTTAMFRLLAQHPDVGICDPKEPYFFCTDFHQEADAYHGPRRRFHVRTETAYLALFRDPSKPVQMDGTPAYLYSATAAANIHAFNPDARIIVMLRDPIELLRSLHAKMDAYGQEDLRDFREALDAEPARRAGRRLPRTLFWPSSLYYSEWSRFADQIGRYRNLFPSDRLKIVLHDDFLRDNVVTYGEVAGFLGLDPAFRPVPETRNLHSEPRFRVASRLIARLGDLPIRKLVRNPVVRMRIGRGLRILNRREAKRPPLDAGLRRELVARFRPEVEKVSALLQRDLVGLWGYR
jgi:hypothetical protein